MPSLSKAPAFAPERDALSVLHSVFGLPGFRGAQQQIIRHVTAGGNCLVLMPTGGGKSLCYQMPALLREGCGIVVSPLIALMRDQVAGSPRPASTRRRSTRRCRRRKRPRWSGA